MKFKKYIPYVLWSLLGCAVLISVAFVSTKQSGVRCTSIKISIDGDDGNYFIENKDVLELLNTKDKQPVGKPLNEINTALLENIINSNPYVANAEVFSTLDGLLHINIKQRNPIAKYLQTDSVANALFTQIYVNENNEIELVPRIGDHLILIGDAANFKKKVDMLLVLYRKGLNKTGWTQYSSINLKFENQVICTKKSKQKAASTAASVVITATDKIK